MLGQAAQAGGGGAVDLKDGGIAEQDGDDDSEEDGQQPMAGGRGAVGLESTADWVR